MLNRNFSTPVVRRAIGLGILSFAVYNINLRWVGSYDSLAASLLPFAVWQGDGVYLDKYTDYPAPMAYSIVRTENGHWASLYPIVTPLLVSPLYFPAAFWQRFRFERTPVKEHFRWLMEKLSASVMASLSVALLYLVLSRLASGATAMVLSVAYAFGTATWTISSQALWQHGAAELLLAFALCLLCFRPPGFWSVGALGLVAALVTANRPTDVFLSVALAVLGIRRWRGRAFLLVLAAVPVVVGLLWYNLSLFGSLSGGYSRFRFPNDVPVRFGVNPLPGVLNLLFSNRGLLFFSPWLTLLVRRRFRAASPMEVGIDRRDALILGAGVIATLIFQNSFNTGWTGGYTYGSRYAADILPVLTVLLAAQLRTIVGWLTKGVAALTVTFAIGLQAIGAFCFPGGDSGRERYGVWTLAKSAPMLALKAGPQPPQFLGFVAPGLTMAGPLGADAWRASYRWDHNPAETWRVGSRHEIQIGIRNDGHIRWSSLGRFDERNGIRISIRWVPLAKVETAPVEDWDRWLGLRVQPGEWVHRAFAVKAPEKTGRYKLTIDLVQLGVGRFSENGCPKLEAAITVVK